LRGVRGIGRGIADELLPIFWLHLTGDVRVEFFQMNTGNAGDARVDEFLTVDKPADGLA
jgi:hypothetical protein